MSCLRICDSDDCYQSENDVEMYHIDYETAEFLRGYSCSSWFNEFDDICQDCIDNVNDDYSYFFVFDENEALKIGEKYLNNPTLLD